MLAFPDQSTNSVDIGEKSRLSVTLQGKFPPNKRDKDSKQNAEAIYNILTNEQ